MAVVGLGGVGLSSLLGAVAAGARQVVAVDLSDEKLDLARDLGATMTVNARDPDAADQIRAASHGGVEYAFELAGSTRALDLAFRITRRGGTTVTAGLPHPRHPRAHPGDPGRRGALKGSYIGLAVPSRDVPLHRAVPAAGYRRS